MQTLHLQGGFGEKGRTSLLVDDGDTCLMLDAGIKVGADGDYHPRLAKPARGIDALFITHAHEDHIGALCWLLGQGFGGPVYMTATTYAEMAATLAQYARPQDLIAYPPDGARITLFAPGDRLQVGAQIITTGHTGHVAGGVWFGVHSGGRRTVYCGDVVPQSAVFPMTPLPECDLLILDCSYGDDRISADQRGLEIAAWVAANPACVMPTPLSGRSLELLALLPGPLAIAADMDAPLRAQLAGAGLIRPGVSAQLLARLDAAQHWHPGADLPDCALLVHDGMGVSGPSVAALTQAQAVGHPVLLTGHLPDGSMGQRMYHAGRAAWRRMPTHPTLTENHTLWTRAGRPPLLGHSCDSAALVALHPHLSALNITARTGDHIKVPERRA
jgi:phosphoribosyl 1,2-cyclic phosphodiesterase